MVRSTPAPRTYFEREPYAKSFGDSQFNYMVEAIEDLRNQLVQQYPYDWSRLKSAGYINESSPVEDIQFEPDKRFETLELEALTPSITWWKKPGKSRVAWTHYPSNSIHMNAWFDLEHALDTFRHEYAHLATHFISRSNTHHDSPWDAWAVKLGTRPVSYTYKPVQYDWRADSPDETEKRLWFHPHDERELWIAPLLKKESSIPHDAIYEGRLVADKRIPFVRGSNILRHLIALHPNPYIAATIASNTNIPIKEKVALLSSDVIPDVVAGENKSLYEKSLPKLKIPQVKHTDEVDRLSPSHLLERYGASEVETRRAALQRIIESNPKYGQHGVIAEELREAESVLESHRASQGATRMEEATLPALGTPSVEPEDSYRSISLDKDDIQDWVEFRVHYLQEKMLRALDGAQSFTPEDEERLREYYYFLNTRDIPATRDGSEALADKAVKVIRSEAKLDFQDPDTPYLIEIMTEMDKLPSIYTIGFSGNIRLEDAMSWVGHRINQVNNKLLALRYKIMQASIDEEELSRIEQEIRDLRTQEAEYRYFLNTGEIPKPRTEEEIYAHKYAVAIDEFQKMPSEYRDDVWSNDFDEYLNFRLERDDFDEPTQTTAEQMAFLRMYADWLPDLADIAHEAEQYTSKDAQAVINDLAKEFVRRYKKDTTTRGAMAKRRVRSSGPKSNG